VTEERKAQENAQECLFHLADWWWLSSQVIALDRNEYQIQTQFSLHHFSTLAIDLHRYSPRLLPSMDPYCFFRREHELWVQQSGHRKDLFDPQPCTYILLRHPDVSFGSSKLKLQVLK